MVKYIPDATGRFQQRPHYEPSELDRECEAIILPFLRQLHGEEKFPIRTDDLTKLIERDADDLDLYADLSEFGPNVEGVTEFRPGRKPIVKISKELMEASHRENRLRTTLTHEYGHVRFHAYLWEMERPNADLLNRPHRNKVICKRDSIVTAKKVDWLEWQAGYVSGSILMPRTRVKTLMQKYQEEHSIFGQVRAEGEHGAEMIALIVQEFKVSEDAARVRLSVLNYLGHTSQPSLFA